MAEAGTYRPFNKKRRFGYCTGLMSESFIYNMYYTYYTIPYYSVVPELTEDYDERTSIRSLSSLLNVFAVAVGNALPALAGVAVFTTVKEYNASTDAALKAEADASLFATQEHGYLIIAAFIAVLAGQLLTAYGYDSGKYEQALSDVTVNGIENISTVFPAILLAVSIVGLILYPMTRARFELLRSELEKKRRGEPSDGAGLEKLVTKKQLEAVKNRCR